MDDDHADVERAGRLHHVEVYASDLDAAVDFWSWLLGELGLEPENEWGRGRSWRNQRWLDAVRPLARRRRPT